MFLMPETDGQPVQPQNTSDLMNASDAVLMMLREATCCPKHAATVLAFTLGRLCEACEVSLPAMIKLARGSFDLSAAVPDSPSAMQRSEWDC